MPQDERYEPENADVWSQDYNAGYGSKTVTAFFLIILGIFLLAGFAYFFVAKNTGIGAEQNTSENQESESFIAGLMDEDNFPVEDVDISVAQAVKTFIPDREQVLPDRNYIDDNVYTANKLPDNDANNSQDKNNYNDSFFSIIDSDIKGVSGNDIGELHDIIIDKNTGEARVIVVEDDDSFFETSLEALSFQNVAYQENDGDIQTDITELAMDSRQDFNYSLINEKDYISLKSLNNGEVYDDQRKYVGQIDALILQNAEVNNVYFSIKPELSRTKTETTVRMPFDNLNIIRNPDGYDIQLSKEETRQLADMLFSQSQ